MNKNTNGKNDKKESVSREFDFFYMSLLGKHTTWLLYRTIQLSEN